MNIEEYRAMVASEKDNAESTATSEQTTTATETPASETTPETTPIPEEAPVIETLPTKLNIDGEDVDVDTLKQWKLGNMRNQDYTRKTQEVAELRRQAQHAIDFYNHVKSNPELSKSLLEADEAPVVQRLNPSIDEAERTKQELYDLKVQAEIRDMQEKYGDEFDVTAALNMAVEKKLSNLDDAHLFVQALKAKTPNIESQQPAPTTPPSTPVTPQVPQVNEQELRDRLRAELLAEIDAERNSTQTIISTSGSTPVGQTQEITLTDEQAKIAKAYGVDPATYMEWLNKSS